MSVSETTPAYRTSRLNDGSLEAMASGRSRLASWIGSLRYLDLPLILAMIALTTFGLWVLFGTVHESPWLLRSADRQITWFGIALCGMALTLVLDYNWLSKLAPYAYAANLGLLGVVLFAGTEVNGSTSWFRLGPIGFQPSETMKIVTVMMVARWYSLRPEGVNRVRDLIVPGLLCAMPMGLVVLQPDLGSACMFGVIFGATLYWAGVKRWILGGLFVGGAVGAACAYPFIGSYAQKRLLTFIDPYHDPTGASYNLIQSLTAVGNGGLMGEGWGQGTQGLHRWLPEAHTDFIFASAVEQTGFIGMLLILGLYAVLFWRILETVGVARDRFGGILAIGLGSILAGHVFINMAMNIGLFPITGLPLPFFCFF